MRGIFGMTAVGVLAACAGPATTMKPGGANTAVAIPAGTPEPTPGAGGVTAEIVAAGTTTAEATTSQSAPDTALGSVDVVPGEVHISPASTIVAGVGTSFGIQVLVNGAPERTIVPLRTRVTHPPIANPETGKTATVDAWASPMNVGIPRYTGWRFDHPWEVVPGTWRIELLEGDRPIAAREFTVAAGAPSSEAAVAVDQPEPPVDLPALIECRAGIRDYFSIGFKITGDPDAAKAMGWVEVKQPNPFLKEYRLPKAIAVFGHRTKNIAFASAGLLAILDDVSPKAFAAKLGLTDAVPGSSKVLFAKTIKEEKVEGATKTIRLNLSTVDTHPGQTLVGCEYRIDVN